LGESWSGYLKQQQTLVVMGPHVRAANINDVEIGHVRGDDEDKAP